MNTHSKPQIAVAIILSLSLLTGCGKRRDTTENKQEAFITGERNYNVVLIVIDLSGSFSGKMAEDGKAYEFALYAIDQYFRHSDPLNDRIILTQISGSELPLLWEGTPLELRNKFPSADLFRDFLLSKANNGGSLVHYGVANAVDYLTYHPHYGSNRSKSVTLILSDMDDNGGSSGSLQHLDASLTAYGQIKGSVGIYFCNQSKVEDWKNRLSRVGIQNYIVESEIVGKPQLPNFE